MAHHAFLFFFLHRTHTHTHTYTHACTHTHTHTPSRAPQPHITSPPSHTIQDMTAGRTPPPTQLEASRLRSTTTRATSYTTSGRALIRTLDWKATESIIIIMLLFV